MTGTNISVTSLSPCFHSVLAAFLLGTENSPSSKQCVHTALVAGKTRTLVTRVERDLIGWCMPQVLGNCVISGGPQATIRMQFGGKLHAFCRSKLTYMATQQGNIVSMNTYPLPHTSHSEDGGGRHFVLVAPD